MKGPPDSNKCGARSCTIASHPGGNVQGDGGRGGDGIIQLQVPFGTSAIVEDPADIVPAVSYVDPNNMLNPSEFTPISVALTRRYDMGRVVTRSGTSPTFRFFLNGKRAQKWDDGFVPTDAQGFVLNPDKTDIVCDYLGQLDAAGLPVRGEEPRENFIPPNATVQAVSMHIEVFNPSVGAYQIFAVLRDWEEGEATWNQARNGQPWQSPGAEGALDRGATILGSVAASLTGPNVVAARKSAVRCKRPHGSVR